MLQCDVQLLARHWTLDYLRWGRCEHLGLAALSATALFVVCSRDSHDRLRIKLPRLRRFLSSMLSAIALRSVTGRRTRKRDINRTPGRIAESVRQSTMYTHTRTPKEGVSEVVVARVICKASTATPDQGYTGSATAKSPCEHGRRDRRVLVATII